jgi:hypothetical protein
MDQPFECVELPRHLAESAIELHDFGVHEVAWSRADALAVLAHLDGGAVPVLGGDVLSSVRPLTYAYANWHADPFPGEDVAVYAARSQRTAREYIAQYPAVEAWFVLVLGKPLSDTSKRSSNDRCS